MVNVEQNAENGLRSTGILDNLLGKEDILYSTILDQCALGLSRHPLVQEDQTMDGSEE